MSEWEERRCGDERGVGQAVAAIMHTCGGGARVVAEVGGAAPRIAWLGRVCFKQPVVRARAGAAPRAEFQPEFQLEDAKRGVPGRRVRVWANCVRWKCRQWGRHGKGRKGVASKRTEGDYFWRGTTDDFGAPNGVRSASRSKNGFSAGRKIGAHRHARARARRALPPRGRHVTVRQTQSDFTCLAFLWENRRKWRYRRLVLGLQSPPLRWT